MLKRSKLFRTIASYFSIAFIVPVFHQDMGLLGPCWGKMAVPNFPDGER